MRFSDERYRRRVAQHKLALRMLAHEVRNGTICAWTGLSPHRVRALYTSYIGGAASSVQRHRGKPPRQLAFLLRAPRLRVEAAVLGGILKLLGLLSAEPTGRGLPTSLSSGLRLCEAYEMYTGFVDAPRLTLEQTILLCNALSRGDEIRLATCASCGGAVIEDRMELRAGECAFCESEVQSARGAVVLARNGSSIQRSSDVNG